MTDSATERRVRQLCLLEDDESAAILAATAETSRLDVDTIAVILEHNELQMRLTAARLLSSPKVVVSDAEGKIAVESLIRATEGGIDVALLCRCIRSLGSLALRFGADRIVSTIIKWSNYPEREVRLASTAAMFGIDDHRCLTRCIELLADVDDDVRSWAAFALCESGDDTPEIIESLFGLLGDKRSEVRAEAIYGLAIRKDRRAIPAIKIEIASRVVGSKVVEAARDLADEALLDDLLSLSSWWDVDPKLLNDAIAASRTNDPASSTAPNAGGKTDGAVTPARNEDWPPKK